MFDRTMTRARRNLLPENPEQSICGDSTDLDSRMRPRDTNETVRTGVVAVIDAPWCRQKPEEDLAVMLDLGLESLRFRRS